MRAVLQRVSRAQVDVDGNTVARMEGGLLILLGVTHTDGKENAEKLARKCAQLRIFPDEEEKMNRSLLDVGGAAIVVSQFTLFADAARACVPHLWMLPRPNWLLRWWITLQSVCAGWVYLWDRANLAPT